MNALQNSMFVDAATIKEKADYLLTRPGERVGVFDNITNEVTMIAIVLKVKKDHNVLT